MAYSEGLFLEIPLSRANGRSEESVLHDTWQRASYETHNAHHYSPSIDATTELVSASRCLSEFGLGCRLHDSCSTREGADIPLAAASKIQGF